MPIYNGDLKQFEVEADSYFDKCMERPSLTIPKWTNSALAAELALKFLFLREQKSYGAIHDLHELFCGLPEIHRTELMVRFKNRTHQTDEMIEEQIKIFSDAFIKSRYFYEHGSFGLTGFFDPFVKIVCEYASEFDE